MDFAAEDRLRDQAYDIWRQLSVEPPISFTDPVFDRRPDRRPAQPSSATHRFKPQQGTSTIVSVAKADFAI